MNARELMDDILFALGPAKESNAVILSIALRIIAEHVYELRDAGDFHQKMLDLADAARLARPAAPKPIAMPPRPQTRWDDTCPRCGHVHEGVGECGVQMGKDRICRCEVEVSA
jgi:hypothetical protein